MLHALSGLYSLTSDARYLKEFQEMLPAYSDYSQKVASGVAHALEAATVHAAGIAVMKVKSGSDLGDLKAVLGKQRWRRIFIQTVDADTQSKTYQLCVGSHCLEATDDLAVATAAL